MIKKIALALTALVLGVATIAMPAPAMASNGPSQHSETTHTDGTAKTAILKSCATDDGKGGGILCLLREGLDILSWIVGALGFAALVFVGFQYLTAGDNEEQVKKAKRRIVEIVIGVALFLLANVIVQWLTGTDPNASNSGSNNGGSSEQQSSSGGNR
jgi:amino acid transporter